MTTHDKRFVKDVAAHVDRRAMRRKLLGWAVVIGAIVAAVLYARCGSGFGFGKGKGKGDGKGSGSAVVAPVDPGPRLCAIRVAAAGITVDGKPATRDEAIRVCRTTEGASVLVTGDARQGDWDELRAALEASAIPYEVREPRGVVAPGADAGAPK